MQYGDPLYASVQMLGVRGVVAGYDDMRYGATDLLASADRTAIDEKLGSPIDWPSNDISRGDAAMLVASTLA